MMSMVSPKTADPALRTEMVEAAARLVATEGRAGLTIRRLAKEVGTSTMAVYTHFGGMDELRRQVRREGFARLREQLDGIRSTRDPVADLSLLGVAYYLSATAAPNLYRAMFMDGPVDDTDSDTGLDTFMRLVNGIERCVEVGRFSDAEPKDPAEKAVELWGLTHGLVSLQLAHMLPESQALERLETSASSLFVAWGDDVKALARSMARARRRIGEELRLSGMLPV
jgi:AcrR family transcriptional regulator